MPLPPPNHSRRTENAEKRMAWVQSLHMAIPCNTSKLYKGNGHQLDPFPRQIGQTEPNTAMRWASKKCAMQWAEATKIQELIVEVFSSFVSPMIILRTSRFRKFLKIYAVEDTGYNPFTSKFEMGIKDTMHTLGIVRLCISPVILSLHVFLNWFLLVKLGWCLIEAATWVIIIAALLSIFITTIGVTSLKGHEGSFEVEVFDSKSNYIILMKSIFYFQFVLKVLPSLKFLVFYDAFLGALGAYVKHIIVEDIVAPESSLLHCKPVDFGGGHVELNLAFAKELVACMGLGNSVRLQHYQECRSKLAKIASNKKPTSIIKGALYIWSTFINVFVQHYYANPLINKVFTLEQYFACLVDALSSFVEDLYRLGAIELLHKNVTGTIVSNATVWNTLKLLAPEAVQKYYSEGINMILQCESFMHFNLVLDAEGMCSDLGIHQVVVNNHKREIDAYQQFLLLSVPSVLITNLAPLGKHDLNAYLPGTKPFEEWKNLYNLEEFENVGGIPFAVVRLLASKGRSIFCYEAELAIKFLPIHCKNWDPGGDHYFVHITGSLQCKLWDPGRCFLVYCEGPLDLKATCQDSTINQQHCPYFNLEDKVNFNGGSNVMTGNGNEAQSEAQKGGKEAQSAEGINS